MQIRYATARGMGYTGSASGLLDANTNLTYAVPYLANAYKVAGGNPDRAVSLYAGGYYYEAKRKGLLRALRTGVSDPVATGSIARQPNAAYTLANPQ
jgi:soluble lytic murein transglycosylase-like protein